MKTRSLGSLSLLAASLFSVRPDESHAQHFFSTQTDYRAPVLGSRPYLNVLVKFADTAQVTPHPREFYDKLLGNEPGGLDHYIREISYGKANLAGSRTVEWITLSRAQAAYRGTGKPSVWKGYDLMSEALKKISAQINLSEFYGINFFVNVTDDYNASQWTFWFPVAGKTRPIRVTLINPQVANSQIVVHEMLHHWGFDHTCFAAADIPTAPESNIDPMGNEPRNRQPPHAHAYHKLRAGWLDAAKVYEAIPGSAETVRIERLALPKENKGYLLARIPIAGAFSEYYTVECRRKAGYDTALTGEGIAIHHVDESTFNPTSNPPHFERAAQCIRSPKGGSAFWRPGEVFSNGISGIIINVLDEDATGCTIKIGTKSPSPTPGVVTSTADSGAGSLRDTLSWAQRQSNGAKIHFAIPRTDPNFRNGVYSIRLKRPLPYLFTDGIELTAPTQRQNGFVSGGDKPGVFLDGAGVPAAASGLVLRSRNCAVKNVAIGNFREFGIWVQGLLAKSNRIENCFIGTTPDGTIAAPNGRCGIAIYEGATSTLVVSNLVSGNKDMGIQLLGTWFILGKPVHGIEVSDNVIVNNRIGTDFEGKKPLPNRNSGIAICDGSVRNQIGTPDGKGGNVISGNINTGIVIIGFGTTGNRIVGNIIGMNASNTAPLPNSFPPLQLLSGNTVSDNIVYPSATVPSQKR